MQNKEHGRITIVHVKKKTSKPGKNWEENVWHGWKYVSKCKAIGVRVWHRVTSQDLHKVGKGTAEKMSLETTARQLEAGTVQTWRDVLVRSRHEQQRLVSTSIASNVFDSLWNFSTTFRRRRDLLFQFRLQIFRQRVGIFSLFFLCCFYSLLKFHVIFSSVFFRNYGCSYVIETSTVLLS